MNVKPGIWSAGCPETPRKGKRISLPWFRILGKAGTAQTAVNDRRSLGSELWLATWWTKVPFGEKGGGFCCHHWIQAGGERM